MGGQAFFGKTQKFSRFMIMRSPLSRKRLTGGIVPLKSYPPLLNWVLIGRALLPSNWIKPSSPQIHILLFGYFCDLDV